MKCFLVSLLSILCFVTSAFVSTSANFIPIEEIQAGDYVWAENEETGEKSLKQVVQTFVRESNELVHIKVDGQEITTTPEHPFYVPNVGWTSAAELRAGDGLVLVNGELVVVEFVQHELLESHVTVYNFEVEDFHTYFVSDSAVLVHNTCGKSTNTSSGYDDSVRTVQIDGDEITVGSYSNMNKSGLKDAHHIYQDAAVRDLPGYSRGDALSVQVKGPSTTIGSPHYNTTQAQRYLSGGTLKAEGKNAYYSLRAGGFTKKQAKFLTKEANKYFNSLGFNSSTTTRIPGNRVG